MGDFDYSYCMIACGVLQSAKFDSVAWNGLSSDSFRILKPKPTLIGLGEFLFIEKHYNAVRHDVRTPTYFENSP